MTKIYINQLSPDITETDLFTIFQKFSDVLDIRIQRHPKTKKCTGKAYLELPTAEQAQKCILALHLKTYKNSILDLSLKPHQSEVYSFASEIGPEENANENGQKNLNLFG